MAGGGALAALAPTPPGQQSKEQRQQAVAVNAIRLRAIGDRLRAHLRGGPGALQSADFAHLVYAFARGIDYALSGGDVPKMASEIPDILKKVYQLRKDPFLQSSVMVLIISCKNACFNKWFQPSDSADILRMANEFSGNFCTPLSQPANDSNVLEIISTVMPRYYPQLKFKHLVTSLEAEVGYDILMADFFIHRNLPRDEKINLIVVQKENLDASSCITSPPHVSFLVNGKGVDKRTNVSMETGPQFPSDITRMLRYGANIIQAVGYFNANYIIAVAFVNKLRSFDAPKLDDYAQPVTTDPPDSDILEGPSRVSLKCPISFRRIKTPIKGRLCKHYQCFDYDNYMEMNLRKPTWRCPCCNTPSNFIDLRIDQKMAKVLQETGNDIIDILVFPDGSWKAVSVHDEKSDRHAGEVIQQNVDTVETDATPSDVIDLINGNDDGDLPMSWASASEDKKPLLNSQDLSVADYLLDVPISTTAQPEYLYVGGNNGCSNVTSTSGQNSSLPPTGGLGSSSFGTLESILPQDILRPVLTDAVSPSLETSNSTFAMQHVLQGTHPDVVRLQSLIDPLPGSVVERPPIPRNVRREPVAVQALTAPPQNPGLSRRVQPNVFNCPPPIPQSNSAFSMYQGHQVTNADSVIAAMNTGVGPLSRAPDAASLMHLQSTQQDMPHTSNHLHGRVIAPHLRGIRPPSGVPGQATGANAYAGPPIQQHQHFDQLLVSNLMSQLEQAPPPQTVEVPQVMPSSNLMSQPAQAPPPRTLEVPQVMQIQPGSTVSPDIHSHLFSTRRSQALKLQAAPSRPAIPQAPPCLQSATLPPPAPTASVLPHVGTSDGLPELPVDQNWRPMGRMRGSLTGSAYSQALERYLNTTGQQTSQVRPTGTDARR